MEKEIDNLPPRMSEVIERHRTWNLKQAVTTKRRHEDISINASQQFENLIDAALDDGIMSESEAIMLVREHNVMQNKSREALRKKLGIHGHTFRNRQIQNYSMASPDPRPQPKMGHHKKSGSWGPDFSDALTEGISTSSGSDFTDVIISVGDRVRSSRNLTFALIVGMSIIIVLIKLLGS